MEKKELFRKELYRVCRLCDFLPPKFLEDSLVFWVSQELSKAREEGKEEKKVVEKINKMYSKMIIDRLVNGYWKVDDWEDNWEKDKEFYDRWKVGMPFWKKVRMWFSPVYWRIKRTLSKLTTK